MLVWILSKLSRESRLELSQLLTTDQIATENWTESEFVTLMESLGIARNKALSVFNKAQSLHQSVIEARKLDAMDSDKERG